MAVMPIISSMAYARYLSLALDMRSPIGSPMTAPRSTSGINIIPMPTSFRIDISNIIHKKNICIGTDVANVAKKNPLVLFVDQSCAMAHSTRGGPPIPEMPPRMPLAVKASPAHIQCSFLTGCGRHSS